MDEIIDLLAKAINEPLREVAVALAKEIDKTNERLEILERAIDAINPHLRRELKNRPGWAPLDRQDGSNA